MLEFQPKYSTYKVRFEPSDLLDDELDYWMIESILGSNHVKKFVRDGVLELNKNTIKEIFSKSNVKFWVSEDETRIYSENGLGNAELYGDKKESLKEISSLEALKYSIPILETASEKSYSKIFKDFIKTV